MLEADAARPDGPDATTSHRIAGLEERIAAEIQELARRAHGRCAGGPDDVRYLFIAGCPRSGTTALTTLLNHDERILLGQERFRKIRKVLEPFHFSEDVFFNPTERETSWAMPYRRETVRPGTFADYQALRSRWRSGSVRILGDKAPYYFRQLERLGRVFPEARFVVLVRDLHEVARSYRDRAANPADAWPVENDHRLAVRDWGESLHHAHAFAAQDADRLLLVSYARFFFGAADELDRLYRFLGLEPTTQVRERHAAMVRDGQRRRASVEPLLAAVLDEVDAGRDPELEAWAARAMIS